MGTQQHQNSFTYDYVVMFSKFLLLDDGTELMELWDRRRIAHLGFNETPFFVELLEAVDG